MSSGKPLRLFFALSCPPGLAERIDNWRDSLTIHGRPVPRDNLHLTLAFLGSQPETALDGLKRLGDQLRGEAFTLRLDQLRTIAQGFLCLTPTQVPPPLLQLVDDLRSGLSALGVALDSRPFLPHVTLVREAAFQPPCAAAERFELSVDGFGLFCSESVSGGVRYDEVMRWPLSPRH